MPAESNTQEAIENYLLRFPLEDYELGDAFGFVNSKGDTIIPIGKYQATLTDTLLYFAVVFTEDSDILGVDKSGEELFKIFRYDNGPDYLQEGLFRVLQDDKIGYANEMGEIVIPCQYGCAYPFEDGKARVSMNCSEVKDGEHTAWDSDQWFYIDKTGSKLE